MKPTTPYGLCALTLLAMLLVTCSAEGAGVSTRAAREADISGTFNLIGYGCNFLDDPETVVFLDRADDQYTFEPYAPDFKFRVKKGLSSADALTEARSLSGCSSSFRDIEVRSIIGPAGDLLGYELTPLHRSFATGFERLVETNYWIKRNTVMIMIRVVPAVERLRQGSGPDSLTTY